VHQRLGTRERSPETDQKKRADQSTPLGVATCSQLQPAAQPTTVTVPPTGALPTIVPSVLGTLRSEAVSIARATTAGGGGGGGGGGRVGSGVGSGVGTGVGAGAGSGVGAGVGDGSGDGVGLGLGLGCGVALGDGAGAMAACSLGCGCPAAGVAPAGPSELGPRRSRSANSTAPSAKITTKTCRAQR
jgi:hypothetical protein